ncbi:MAG: hypothetical protein KDA91_07890 [Planctomycetaceae bacterium]|nr:hypothetical protein [Planctomycetaceae bacterium]
MGEEPDVRVLLEDDFNREESDPAKEEIGNGWGTNSKSRAKGVKQVDMVDGAMHITMASVADHGVSVHHEVAFRDATILLRFKLGKGDDLGINIADMNEKSVHAGHICMARIQPKSVEISDLKTGRMKLEHREARLENRLTPEQQKTIAARSEKFPVDLALDDWHQLSVQISGDQMTVTIDNKLVGKFQSEGIGHPTKSRLRLAVNKAAWVDDVRITGR